MGKMAYYKQSNSLMAHTIKGISLNGCEYALIPQSQSSQYEKLFTIRDVKLMMTLYDKDVRTQRD